MTTSHEDDTVLLHKIQVLLDAPHHSDEFLLVALVLLTRVTSVEKVQQVWIKYGDTTLNSYCCRLQERPQYLHIVARLVSQIERGSVGKDVFQVLWQTLVDRVEIKAPPTQLDVDLILSLNASAPDEDTNVLLDTIWQRFRQVQQDMSTVRMTNEQELSNHDATMDASPSSPDEKLVHDTLQALMTTSETDLETSLKEAIFATFVTHGPQACRDVHTVPSWFQPMVLYATGEGSKSLPPVVATQLHGLVLQCTLELTLHSTTELQQVLSYSKSLSTAFVNLILLYISTSPTADNNTMSMNLQSAAWMTCAAMVQAFGLDWTVLSLTNSSLTLGSATSLCTILRLATGEWRIQLGQLLCCVDDDSSSSDAQDGMIVNHHVATVICATLAHVMKLMDTTREEKFQIQASALLHVRDSLQDALHATVQYLCHSSSTSQQVPFQVIAGRVLASLLQEFNVWDGLPNGISTDETLHALSVALHASKDANHPQYDALLPCLVAVLASVDDADYCIKLLDKHHLLGTTLVNFLVSYWKTVVRSEGDSSQCVMAACQVAELWFEMTNPPSSVTAPLRKVILQWIRKQVEDQDHGPSVMEVLPSVVDCYVMLFGQDAVPSERDATIVQRALELCETRQSPS